MAKKKDDFGMGSLMQNIGSEIESRIKESISRELEEYYQKIKSVQPIVIEKDGKRKEITGLKHKNLATLIELVGANQNVMMVGMAGTGKTKGASQVAEALDLPFYCMSVGSQTSKSDLLGFIDAHGNYVRTAFRDAYESGGVFVMDEIDAGNSNVLIVLNSALANDICSFPDGMIHRNKDFRFIATANTYGNGADRSYVGRNQLDGATLDRFSVLDWDCDERLERSLVESLELGNVWCDTVQQIRQAIKDAAIRAIISPRATMKGAMQLELGRAPSDVIDSVIVPQIPLDHRNAIRNRTLEIFETNLKAHRDLEEQRAKEREKKALEAETTSEQQEMPF